MSRLQKIQTQVQDILERFPSTRSNDRLLIRTMYERYYGVDYYDSFGSIMMRTDLPSFESIRRARQKIQADREDLRGDKKSEKARLEKQLDYIRFAKEGA